MDTAQLPRQDFDENGYIAIKNAFTEEEIDKIRSAKHKLSTNSGGFQL